LTGDVGRGCGDASRALLFFCYRFDIQANSIDPCWRECWRRVQASLRPAEIDARFVQVQHSRLHGDGGALGDFFAIVGLSIGVSLAATAIAAAISLPLGAALPFFLFEPGVCLSCW
jgi:hypothetical protein